MRSELGPVEEERMEELRELSRVETAGERRYSVLDTILLVVYCSCSEFQLDLAVSDEYPPCRLSRAL
jgi:hypothetical protein